MVAENQVLAGAAVIFWGLGASLGFPLALSAAGDSEGDATARVAAVSTIGYLAFLVGPPALGIVGEHFGLRAALLIPLALVVVAYFLSRLPIQKEAEKPCVNC